MGKIFGSLNFRQLIYKLFFINNLFVALLKMCYNFNIKIVLKIMKTKKITFFDLSEAIGEAYKKMMKIRDVKKCVTMEELDNCRTQKDLDELKDAIYFNTNNLKPLLGRVNNIKNNFVLVVHKEDDKVSILIDFLKGQMFLTNLEYSRLHKLHIFPTIELKS